MIESILHQITENLTVNEVRGLGFSGFSIKNTLKKQRDILHKKMFFVPKKHIKRSDMSKLYRKIWITEDKS